MLLMNTKEFFGVSRGLNQDFSGGNSAKYLPYYQLSINIPHQPAGKTPEKYET